ncbi:MAG: gliding motility-associated C-terminal domain-containing protein [Flavobacteriales bacterium]|nr:gliding motility-associated C-terminal domain-containing protein [Flavobacteriales bacterium]
MRLVSVQEFLVQVFKLFWRIRVLCIPVLLQGGSAVLAAPLDPLLLHCAGVDVNGTVTLTWTPPSDPSGQFGNYRIYVADAVAGPFVPIGTVGVLGVSTWADPVSNGAVGPLFYYVTTITNAPVPEESLPSDTISTIHLQLYQSVPPGSANLIWVAPQPASSANDTFTVWMEYPVGSLQIIAELPATTLNYQHVVSVCDDSLTFHIERSDANGCTSSSNWAGDRFQDVTPPTSPLINAVTVDTITGLASIDWEPSPELDTDGYIIVFNAPNGAVIIDTVFGRTNTEFEWAESLAELGSEGYSVAAFDTCRTGVPPSPNTSVSRPFHNTMHLEHFYDECAGTVTLQWSPYGGWPVEEHAIYAQRNGGAWILAGSVGGGSTTFVLDVVPFTNYCFAVLAYQGVGLASSLSNSSCVSTDYPGLPAFNYLRTVTVADESTITIADSVDVNAIVQGYRLERSMNGGAFEPIQVIGPTFSPVIIFTDTDVDPGTTSYRYRVVVLDGCGAASVVSNIGENIILRAAAELSGFDRLEWNGYEDWAGTVQAYALYRQIADGAFSLRTIAPADPWVFMDDVSSLTSTTGRFCYYVVAVESGNASGINMTSTSNVACAVQEELVYIPNAFIVGGNNPVFLPQLAYADVSEYELSIINRWGQIIWTTTDHNQPWDGTVGGRAVPMGVYAYYCNFKNGAGRVFEKRGTVTMLTAVE